MPTSLHYLMVTSFLSWLDIKEIVSQDLGRYPFLSSLDRLEGRIFHFNAIFIYNFLNMLRCM
jgi:hypothetical protein